MIARLTDKYGGLKSGDINAYLGELDKPYDPTNAFLVFLTERNKIYRALRTVNYTIMEDQKVSALISAVTNGARNTYESTYDRFREDFPTSWQ